VCNGNADTLVLDASLSYGFKGLAPIFEWTFSRSVDGTLTPPQTLFVAPYADYFSLSNDTVSLPSTLLTVDTPYTFYVRALRPAAKGSVPSTTVSTTVVRRDTSLLKVTVAASPSIVYRSAPVSLDASVALCADGGALRRLLSSLGSTVSYQWLQSTGPIVTAPSVVWNAFRLLLPAATLDAFATYSFGVVVTSTDATIPPAGANVTFVVHPAVPVALIAGAQYRTLPYDDALTLDASSSFDPGYVSRGSSNLAFFWQFPTLTAATPMTSACQAQHAAFLSTWVTLDLMSPQLVLAAQSNLLCVGLEYRFTVVVSHANLPAAFANEPSSTAFAIVVGEAAPPPPAADTVVHSMTVNIVHLDAGTFFLDAFPPGEKVRLQATVTHTAVTYEGVLQISNGILETVVVETSRVVGTHTEIEIEVGYRLVYRWSETHTYFDARNASNLAGSPDVSSLILGTNTLTPSPANSPSTLRLDVSLFSPLGREAAVAYSQIDVTLNAPPTMETMTIAKTDDPDSTTNGFAGATLYAIECVGAADPNEPLEFVFSYAFVNTPTKLFPLTTRLSSPRTDVVLPVGTVVVICCVFDSFGAKSLPSAASPSVTVVPLPYLAERTANDTCVESVTTSSGSTLSALLAPTLLEQQSVSLSLQQVNSYYTSIMAKDCVGYPFECSLYDLFVDSIALLATKAIANDELTDETAQQISMLLTDITLNSTIGECPDAFNTTVTTLVAVVAAVNNANTGTNSTAPVGSQALTGAGATTVLETVSGTLSSLGATATNCEQFADVTALVDATLVASSAGSVNGETSDGIDTDSFTASTTRVGGATSDSTVSDSNVVSSSTGDVQFDVPVEAIGGRECADIQIVVKKAQPATACRFDADSGAGGPNTIGSGLDQPASNIVEADIVDCAGNVIDVKNLVAPISFLIPLSDGANVAPSTLTQDCPVDSFYLPNSGDIASKQVVVEKEVECTFFDEETQQWSSDGCVVADDNVVQPDGSRAVRCECTHLTEFAILLRSKSSNDVTECNLAPASVFGSIIFLVFACLFLMLLLVGARQTCLTFYAFGTEHGSMLVQHLLLCVVCTFRIILCVIYYALQYSSVRSNIEFRAVAAISGIPYICMLWLFSFVVTNWATFYYAAKRNDLGGIASSFEKVRSHFIGINVIATVLLGSLFVTIGATTNAKLRASLTLAGSITFAIVVFAMSVSYAIAGYGVMKQLSKDFASTSATRTCKVGLVFGLCFFVEAVIWLISGIAPELFFDNFELLNSIFFSFDLIALACILLITRRTLKEGVSDKASMVFKPEMMMRKGPRPSKVTPEESAKSSKLASRATSKHASRRASMTKFLVKACHYMKNSAKLLRSRRPSLARDDLYYDPDDPAQKRDSISALVGIGNLSPIMARRTSVGDLFFNNSDGDSVMDMNRLSEFDSADHDTDNRANVVVASDVDTGDNLEDALAFLKQIGAPDQIAETHIEDVPEDVPEDVLEDVVEPPDGKFMHWFENLSDISSASSELSELSLVTVETESQMSTGSDDLFYGGDVANTYGEPVIDADDDDDLAFNFFHPSVSDGSADSLEALSKGSSWSDSAFLMNDDAKLFDKNDDVLVLDIIRDKFDMDDASLQQNRRLSVGRVTQLFGR
jgi:hypothetical protein